MHDSAPEFPASDADPIKVPAAWRDRAVAGLPASGRLRHALTRWGCHTLGDLEGRDFAGMRALPSCGQTTVEELRRVLARATGFSGDDAAGEELPVGGIFVPEAARGASLAHLNLSVRLHNVCERAGLRLLGDLHGRSYEWFAQLRNCGRNSLAELARLVRRAEAGELDPVAVPPGEDADGVPPTAPGAFQVPAFARSWPLTVLPLSARLRHLCEALGCRELGDLHGRQPAEVLQRPNCGRKTLVELTALLDRVRAGEFSPAAGDADAGEALRDLPELVRHLDERVPGLPPRTREALLARLGGDGAAVPPTLEEVGARFGVTRERIRQLVNAAAGHLRREGGPRLVARLGRLADHCLARVVPLTPELLAGAKALAGGPPAGAFPPAFYLRLLGEMEPRLPTWPAGRDGHWLPAADELTLCRELRAWLAGRHGASASFAETLAAMRERPGLRELAAEGFIRSLRNHRAPGDVDFTDPACPLVIPGRRTLRDWVGEVLGQAGGALTPEEILARGQALSEAPGDLQAASSILNLAGHPGGIYLLGPRRLGLRAHFQLPGGEWEIARADFAALLAGDNRPVSTAEVVNARRFAWTERTNAHELAELLAEDARFTDLGKFLFALRTWGVEERQHVADLVPEILRAAGHPLPTMEISNRLQRLRSASPTSLSVWMGRMAGVRDHGFGYWGRTDGDEFADLLYLAGREDYVSRAVSRAGPPLTFARLCALLGMPAEGPVAARLWTTLGGLRRVRLSVTGPHPDPTARLAHERWRLKHALLDLLAGAGEPLSLADLRRRLHELCPFAFAGRKRSDLERSLHACPSVARTPAGGYLLLGPGANAGDLLAACAEVLAGADGPLDGEELLERLAARGAAEAEAMTPKMLAACLRGDPNFAEAAPGVFTTAAGLPPPRDRHGGMDPSAESPGAEDGPESRPSRGTESLSQLRLF